MHSRFKVSIHVLASLGLVFIDIFLVESAQLLSVRASSRDAGGGGGQWTEERD